MVAVVLKIGNRYVSQDKKTELKVTAIDFDSDQVWYLIKGDDTPSAFYGVDSFDRILSSWNQIDRTIKRNLPEWF